MYVLQHLPDCSSPCAFPLGSLSFPCALSLTAAKQADNKIERVTIGRLNNKNNCHWDEVFIMGRFLNKHSEVQDGH